MPPGKKPVTPKGKTVLNRNDSTVGYKTPKKAVTPNYARPQSQTVAYQKAYQAANNALPPSYMDPFNGVDPLTALLTNLGQTPGGSGGSSRGRGGGGGGGGGPTAADIAARNASLDQLLQEQLAALGQGYGGQQSALDQLLASRNQGYDQRQGQLGQINTQAQARLGNILGELTSGAAKTRGETQASYGQGDQRLQALLSEYQKLSANRDQASNQTLGAFGAQPVGPSGAGVEDLIFAGRTANTMRGNAADQMYANRGNVYNALNADAKTQYGQTFDALLAQLAQQRQASAAEVAQQKAAVALAQAQAEAQAKIEAAKAKVA